jgi:hypothetical protein
MKKLFVAATLGLALVSCGGPSVCDCMKIGLDMVKEGMDAKDDAARKAIEDKYADQIAECDKLTKGKSADETKAMMEEAAKCL